MDLLARVEVGPEHLGLTLNLQMLRTAATTADPIVPAANITAKPAQLAWQIPMRFRRRGQEIRLVVLDATPHALSLGNFGKTGNVMTPKLDQTLLKAVARARSWFDELRCGTSSSLEDIAKREGFTANYLSRLLPLAFLAPDIMGAIAQGRQPVELTTAILSSRNGIPFDWAEQRRVFGLGQSRLL